MTKSLRQLAKKTGLQYVGPDTDIETIAINSNEIIGQNCLFAAIIANRDGHQFIPMAISNGAKALLVSQKQEIDIPQVICEDTTKGLQALAKEYRKELKIPIISVTGSCGKTTTKQMIKTLLTGKKVHYTKGNLNSSLGVSMTILETPQNAQIAVLQAGTSMPGQIKTAADMVGPGIALITNIGASHLENLKSLDGVMTEKGELFAAVSKDGVCIVNIDDERIRTYSEKLVCKKITCSLKNPQADVFVKNIHGDKIFDIEVCIFSKSYRYQLPNMGKHNIFNSVLAIASLIGAGFQPEEFLHFTQNIKAFFGRFCIENVSDHLTLVDDTYNASVEAIRAAIEDLSEFKGRKILVVSTMRELGEEAPKYHQKIGSQINKANLNSVLLFGEKQLMSCYLNQCEGSNTIAYEEKGDLKKDLAAILKACRSEDTKLTIKGARKFQMEEIANFVRELFSSII